MTAKKDLRAYLQDILSAIARITEYTADGKEVFLVDTKTQDAVLHQFSIIGEAAAKLPSSTRAHHPDVPWKTIIGMRNIIIHEYSDIQISRIWQTIEQDVTPLKHTIDVILREKASQVHSERR